MRIEHDGFARLESLDELLQKFWGEPGPLDDETHDGEAKIKACDYTRPFLGAYFTRKECTPAMADLADLGENCVCMIFVGIFHEFA
jgi:hypothetical protein